MTGALNMARRAVFVVVVVVICRCRFIVVVVVVTAISDMKTRLDITIDTLKLTIVNAYVMNAIVVIVVVFVVTVVFVVISVSRRIPPI